MGDSGKPIYINPLLGFITERLQNAFLKNGSTTEFYEVLDVPPNASLETIRTSYRRKALEYHPDKIKQRHRREPTEEEKEMDLKIKEVYKVLSDPRRRKIYNRLGSEGYRFAENPGELMQSEDGGKIIIENFQRNNADKILALSLIFGIIFAGILQPILICLKVDGELPSATWFEVLIPLFLFDFFLIIDGLGGLCMPNNTEADDDGNLPEQITPVDRVKAFLMLSIYILLVVFQVNLASKLDDNSADSPWTWNTVFIPWYLWEALRVGWLVQETCFTTIERPELLGGDEEEGEDAGAGVNNEINMQKLVIYYSQLGQQKLGNWTIRVCVLRFCFAIFLAAKLDGNVDWNWGLVMLPVWIFLLFQGVFACYFKIDGDMMMDGIDPQTLEINPNVEDHAKVMYGSNMNGTCANMCAGGCGYTLMFVLLVVAVQVETISSFLIILPLWFMAFGILTTVFCFFCFLGLADTSQMDNPEEMGHLRGDTGAYQPPPAFATATTPGTDTNDGAGIPVVLATAVASSSTDGSGDDKAVGVKEASGGPPAAPEPTVTASAAVVAPDSSLPSAPTSTGGPQGGLSSRPSSSSDGDRNPLISGAGASASASGEAEKDVNDID